VPTGIGGNLDGNVISYKIGFDGTLSLITNSEPLLNSAACWVEFSDNGRYLYTANTNDGTISSFKVDQNSGKIKLLERIASQQELEPGQGGGLLDLAFSGNFLYAFNSRRNAEVFVFEFNPSTGGLTARLDLTITDNNLIDGISHGIAAF